MRKLILFINGEPAKLLRSAGNKNQIIYVYPDGKVRTLSVKITFATFLNGKSGAIASASDRPVCLAELLDAYDTLITPL